MRAEAEIRTEGSEGDGGAEYKSGGARTGAMQGGGRVELSEAETFWDGPHPSPRSRRPPRL